MKRSWFLAGLALWWTIASSYGTAASSDFSTILLIAVILLGGTSVAILLIAWAMIRRTRGKTEGGKP